MSGHWPYIIAAYTICFVLFAADWFASVFELKALKRDSIMRQRRAANRPEASRPAPDADPKNSNKIVPSNSDKPMDISNE